MPTADPRRLTMLALPKAGNGALQVPGRRGDATSHHITCSRNRERGLPRVEASSAARARVRARPCGAFGRQALVSQLPEQLCTTPHCCRALRLWRPRRPVLRGAGHVSTWNKPCRRSPTYSGRTAAANGLSRIPSLPTKSRGIGGSFRFCNRQSLPLSSALAAGSNKICCHSAAAPAAEARAHMLWESTLTARSLAHLNCNSWTTPGLSVVSEALRQQGRHALSAQCMAECLHNR